MSGERHGTVRDLNLGAFLKLPASEVTEIFVDAGYDHVVLDLEHSALSMGEASRSIAVGHARGAQVLVRIPSHDPFWFQRCLDSGAAGLVVPHVDSAAEAAKAVSAARFPPLGTRGVGPTSRQGRWGSLPLDQYLQRGDSQLVIAQIESNAALEDLDEILATGVDAILLGPADLSVELGISATGEEMREVRRRVLKAAQRAGVTCGVAVGNGAAAESGQKLGYDFTVCGNDLTLLYSGAVANNPFHVAES